MPRRVVTDSTKRVTDPVLLKHLERLNIASDGVEFIQDYGPRVKGKSSPYMKRYKNLNGPEEFAVFSGLPMTDHLGMRCEPRWSANPVRFTARNNIFTAVVKESTGEIELRCRNDQPDGRKALDKLTFRPQLFLDGVEQTPSAPTLLPVDPINPNYAENTLEWDFGVCKRRLRLIEGRITGRWVFASDPGGEVVIRYNQTGDYRLKLGQYATDEDTETIPASVFSSATYPFEVSDSATYYPDADAETTSVDGFVQHSYGAGGEAWATLIAAAGTLANDSAASMGLTAISADDVEDKWGLLRRVIALFDTSGLPDAATITNATLSFYGDAKADAGGFAPNINVYSSAPAANTSLAAGDFDSLGATAFCDTPITYAGFNTAGYNDFTLNASGLAAIDKTSVSKFGTRNANYDVAASPPVWNYTGFTTSLSAYQAEQGDGYKPKLVVTYTAFPTVTTQAVSSIDITTATGNGNITATGGGNATVRGVCWSVSENPTTADSKTTENGDFGTGAFTASITGLTANTLYHVRAYATNASGTSYGGDVTFTSLMNAQQAAGRYYKCVISATGVDSATSTANRGYRTPTPSMTTQAASSVTATGYTGNGTIVSVSLSNCTRRGFCYMAGTSGDPTTANSVAYDDGTFEAGVYTKAISGLTGGTSYRVRAYAVNTQGTGYGDTVTVLTKPAAPTNVAATKGTNSNHVTITWTNAPGATDHHVWRDAVDLGSAGSLGAYNDTGAGAPTITPGAAVASDGTTTTQVSLSLSGNSVANGTTHTYKVVASNATGNSADSATDTGYRGIPSPGYQWQRSAADSDASYTNIAGATGATHDDTGAPAHL